MARDDSRASGARAFGTDEPEKGCDTICGIMVMPRAVVDTNVVVSAFRSRRGPAFRLVSAMGTGFFEISVSVPLVLEYEEALQRATALKEEEIRDVLRFFCSVAVRQKIFFLWRPLLPDPKDDMILELAVASGSNSIVTYNARDFVPARMFGIEVQPPATFLHLVGV
jgi:putative PIN family toxin of toxin-antitoxin system